MDRQDRFNYLRRIRDEYFYKRIHEIDQAALEIKPGTTDARSGQTALDFRPGTASGDLPSFREYAVNIGVQDFFFSDELLFHFEEDCESMRRLCPVREYDFLRHFPTVLFENGQGLLLDGNNEKEKDFTTPSTTGAGRIIRTIESVFEGAETEVCYVTRSYLTRHGDGLMPDEIEDGQLEKHLPGVRNDKTNVENCYQGRLRYGKIDTNLLADRIYADFARCGKAVRNRFRPSVMVTHLNEYTGVDTAGLAERFGRLYLSDGRTESHVTTYREGLPRIQ